MSKQKICPKCKAIFVEEISKCPIDGIKLELKAEDILIGREIDNRYTILEIVGEGGWGTVYKAYQHSIERYLAIKTLKTQFMNVPNVVSNFFKEARSISKLKHPNTITLHDFGETNDHILYMAMEFLEGETLKHLIQKNKLIEQKRSVYIIAQACDSLDEAHRRGIIHSDLKPANIFLAKGFKT